VTPAGWLDLEAAAEYSRLSRYTLDRATKAKDPLLHLEYRQVKGKRLTKAEWIDEWIERQHNAA
jgi:hypothetical protein